MSLAVKESKSGFSSENFNELLDRAGFPKLNDGRIVALSNELGKAFSTCRPWCMENKGPKTYEATFEVVSHILKKIPGDWDPHSVCAWLYGAKNPFTEFDVDSTLMLDVSLMLTELAKKKGLDLSRADIKKYTIKVYKHLDGLRKEGVVIHSVEDSSDAMNIIRFCLEQPND